MRRATRITRRSWLALASLGAATPFGSWRAAAAQDAGLESIGRRVAAVIQEYGSQGYHRTGTTVDHASGQWLAEQVRHAGLVPALEPFPLNRVDPVASALLVGDRRIDGVPLFDGAFTAASGERGRIGPLGSDAEIGLTRTGVNAAGTGPLGEARRAALHRAIVAITEGRRPGLCPSNADEFLTPFGPPVLQVSSEEADWLTAQAARAAPAQLIAHVARTPTTAHNVTAVLEGRDATLPPVIVMTPRSGWYWCASERGGGIACWLEVMRGLQTLPPRRSVLFVASSGHELGHLGIDAYIARRPGVVSRAAGWLHLGANIGAAIEPGTTLQASEDALDDALTSALRAVGIGVTRRAPRGRVPAGEAEAVHRGGGRYVSVIGSSGLFHHPDDRGPHAADPVAIATFSRAFIALVKTLADSPAPAVR